MFNAKHRRRISPRMSGNDYTVYEPPLPRRCYGCRAASLLIIGGGAMLFLRYGAPILFGLYDAIVGGLVR